AVNDAIPGLYDKAVAESEIQPLGTPEVDISSMDYGQQLTFTVEVDKRPAFELPDFATLSVQVDGTLVTPDEVEEYLSSIRERFASLKSVQRPVEDGDFVSIDLSASVEDKPVEDAQASGLSYQIGSGSLLDGLDAALIGLSAGETATFRTELASEFDTLGEFRSSTRAQLERVKEMQQVVQARDKALDAVLDAVDIPLPEGIVEAEITQ